MGALILVVEDEALIADDIQRTLVSLGYEVPLPVATAREAVAAAAALRPALALMDIKLQGTMDGIEAASAIRNEFDIPVVFLTSHSDEATLARAMEATPSGYLVKPFNDRELRTAIEVALHQHELEAKLAERERWFSTTLRSIGDAVIATDPNEKVTFMNPTAELLTGWPSAEAIGRPVGEVFDLVDATGAHLPPPAASAMKEGSSVLLPAGTSLVVRGGGQLDIDDSAAPIIDDRGNALGGVIVFRDVTERKNLERRLAAAQRLASLGTMAAGMGHEINNPLTAVIGNLAYAADAVRALKVSLGALDISPTMDPILVAAFKDIGQVLEALTDADQSADRVRRIVQDLKKFATGEGTSRTLVELSQVLDLVAKRTSHTIRHHARLTKEYGPSPFVDANEGQLVQVFTSLLLNAAEAIEVGRADCHEIRLVTYTGAEGEAVVEVHDTGVGMPPSMLAKIFDPFFTTKDVGEGMGLGLAISHASITALGGEITAESIPGRGSVFRVSIPGARSRTVVPAPTAPIDDEAPSRRGKVLIVDDEVAVSSSLERILRRDHDVTIAGTGREALAAIAAAGRYDVVFCDLMMPKMSGMELYEAVLSESPEQSRRMVFMTGGAFSPRAEEFLDSTANVHISKPFTVATVRAIAKDYVR